MSDMKPLDENEVPDDIAAMLRLARTERPSAASRNRALAACGLVPAIVPAVLASKTAVAGAASLSAKAVLLKVAIVTVVGATIGAGAMWYRSARAPKPDHQATEQRLESIVASNVDGLANQAPIAPAIVKTVEPQPSPASRPRLVATHHRSVVASIVQPTEDLLASELESLSEAKRTLLNGKPAQALSLIERHLHKFTAGALRPEALAVEIDVLVAMRSKNAVIKAKTFLREHPNTPYTRRLAVIANP